MGRDYKAGKLRSTGCQAGLLPALDQVICSQKTETCLPYSTMTGRSATPRMLRVAVMQSRFGVCSDDRSQRLTGLSILNRPAGRLCKRSLLVIRKLRRRKLRSRQNSAVSCGRSKQSSLAISLPFWVRWSFWHNLSAIEYGSQSPPGVLMPAQNSSCSAVVWNCGDIPMLRQVTPRDERRSFGWLLSVLVSILITSSISVMRHGMFGQAPP